MRQGVGGFNEVMQAEICAQSKQWLMIIVMLLIRLYCYY